ncbi:MAG: alkaline phosphatase [Thermoguttaceae bacterium]
MLKTFVRSCLVALCCVTFCVAAEPKNVIIVIGDGMGFNAYRAASYYRAGELGKQSLDAFPVHMSVATLMQAKADVSVPDDEVAYNADAFWKSVANAKASSKSAVTTDSAAAATAMFSGVKTTDGRIGLDGSTEPKRLKLLSELAAERGKAVGSVTTVQASHATPAAFAAHNKSRDNYAEIFTEIYRETPLRVVAGAGDPFKLVGEPDGKTEYKYVGSEEIWNEIVGISKMSQKLQPRHIQIAPARMSIPPVDGLSESAPRGAEDELRKVYKIADGVTFPTLAAWTIDALDTLKSQGGDNGLLLMVEAGAIDWANHDRQINRCVWETTSMLKTIDAIVAWVEKNSSWDETLLIVTADHETGGIWGPGTYKDVNENGKFDKDKEKNTEDEFVAFVPIRGEKAGTIPQAQYAYDGHTSALVPLWARGAGSERFAQHVRGRDKRAAKAWDYSGDFIDNTDIFRVVEGVK